MKAEHAIVTRQSSRTYCTGLTLCLRYGLSLHDGRFLSQQLNAIFVALKLQLKNRTCKPAADLDATMRHRLLIVCSSLTVLRAWRESERIIVVWTKKRSGWRHPVSFLSRPNLAPTPRIERSREKQTASSLHETR